MYTRFLISILFILSFNTSGFSQTPGFRAGIHLGIGEARITKAGISNQTGKLSLQGGLAASYQFTKNIGLVNNILFTTKGSRTSGTETVSGFFGSQQYTYEEDFSLQYIEIPLMLKVSLGLGSFHLKAFSGPSANFNISGNADRTYDDPEYNKDHGFTNKEITGLNLLEYTLVLGGGIDIELSDESVLYLELRESLALNSFGEINIKDAFNQYITAGIGFLYKY